jgi:peptidoglycan/LPS O-acetylase OafA/YrhL
MHISGEQTPGSLKPPAVLSPNAVALLDLLRAAAANLVLAGHAGDVFGLGIAAPLGTMGVGVFFILSGFLITHSSLARMRRAGPWFGPFMIDRSARIFTAYLPALALVAAANAVVDLGSWGQDGVSRGPLAFAGNLLLLQDYPLFQAAHRVIGEAFRIRSYNTAEPFWTIPIEYWIYVVFGLGFFGLGCRERLGRALPLALAAVALPVAIWNAAAGGGDGLTLIWLCGAAGSFVWSQGWDRSRRKLATGLIVLAVAGASLLGRGVKQGWNFHDIGMAACETLILLGALSALDGLATLPRRLRGACAFFASYSYSLYLVHNTALIVVRHALPGAPAAAALAILAAHLVAFAMHLLFERRYRAVGSWLKRRLFRPRAPTSAALPAAAAP